MGGAKFPNNFLNKENHNMWFDIEIVHVKLEPGNSKLCGHSKQATKRPGKFCYKIGLKVTMYE